MQGENAPELGGNVDKTLIDDLADAPGRFVVGLLLSADDVLPLVGVEL